MNFNFLCWGTGTFDVVVVNLYPFYDKVTSGTISFEDGIENIDIGGPTMIRAAAKVNNYCLFFWNYLLSNSYDRIATYIHICDINCSADISMLNGWDTLIPESSVKFVALCFDRTIRMSLL